jgi:type I restriction enzyme S subunit
MSSLNQGILRRIELSLVPLEEQRRMVAILQAYDDLMETNLRRIKVLEEMARAIYREWFVNFRFPGHENTKLIDSDLGPIPSGWSLLATHDLLEHHIGGGWGNESPTEVEAEPAAVIRGTDMPRVRWLDVEGCPRRFHKASTLATRWLKPGDLVLEVSGGSDTYPVGRSVLISQRLLDAMGKRAICASFCKLLRVDSEQLQPELFFLQMQHLYRSQALKEYEVRSTGITNFKFKPFLERHQFVVPPPNLQDAFLFLASPIFDATQILGQAVQTLRATRDLLLPKLISGEIDVSELDIDTSWLAA